MTAGEAITRYFDSRFFKQPNADNILEELLKATTNLPTKSLSMLSMDEPNTKYKLVSTQKIEEYSKSQGSSPIV